MRLVKSKYLRSFIDAVSTHVERRLVSSGKVKFVKGR
jgi:hypothetical protein